MAISSGLVGDDARLNKLSPDDEWAALTSSEEMTKGG